MAETCAAATADTDPTNPDELVVAAGCGPDVGGEAPVVVVEGVVDGEVDDGTTTPLTWDGV